MYVWSIKYKIDFPTVLLEKTKLALPPSSPACIINFNLLFLGFLLQCSYQEKYPVKKIPGQINGVF